MEVVERPRNRIPRPSVASSDGDLVARVRAGDERAFAIIVERYRDPLERYSATIVGRDLAEDVVQQAFLGALVALRRPDERPLVLRPWLYRIARNAALNRVARADHHAEELTDEPAVALGPPELAEQRRQVDQLVSGIAGLPERQRAAIVGFAFEDLTYSQLARRLETTPQCIRGVLERARRSLADSFGALAGVPVWVAVRLRCPASGPPLAAEAPMTAKAIAAATLATVALTVTPGVPADGRPTLRAPAVAALRPARPHWAAAPAGAHRPLPVAAHAPTVAQRPAAPPAEPPPPQPAAEASAAVTDAGEEPASPEAAAAGQDTAVTPPEASAAQDAAAAPQGDPGAVYVAPDNGMAENPSPDGPPGTPPEPATATGAAAAAAQP
jgi:RNA polymerase sigma factor (sigma-70 family)